VKFLKGYPTVRLEVSGHTDNVGGTSANLKLSEQRAKAVADYIVKSGIEKSRLEYKGYGSSQPIAPNDKADGRAMNRRVEFKILSK
jgi:outer membrane protein OmpA-like peptidoglycan-associated protein